MAIQQYWSWEKIYVSSEPNAPKFEEKVKFYDGGEKFGFVSEKRKNSASLLDDLPCAEEACVLTFPSFAKLRRHLDFGYHHYEEKNATQFARISDKWVKRFEGTIEQRSSSYNNIANGEHSKSNLLQMDWAIQERTQKRLNKTRFNKLTTEKAEQRMRKQFERRDYLQVTSIKSYFSRRAAKKKKGEITEDDVVMINPDSSCDETESETGIDYDDEGMDMLDTTREEKFEKKEQY